MVEFDIKISGGITRKVKGYKRNLVLNTGEILEVFVDKRTDRRWCVSDIDTGCLLMRGMNDAVQISNGVVVEPTTMKNALIIAKYELDALCESKKKTFAQILEGYKKAVLL